MSLRADASWNDCPARNLTGRWYHDTLTVWCCKSRSSASTARRAESTPPRARQLPHRAEGGGTIVSAITFTLGAAAPFPSNTVSDIGGEDAPVELALPLAGAVWSKRRCVQNAKSCCIRTTGKRSPETCL